MIVHIRWKGVKRGATLQLRSTVSEPPRWQPKTSDHYKVNAVATSDYTHWYKDRYCNPCKCCQSNTVATRKLQRCRTSSHQKTKVQIDLDDEEEKVMVIEEALDEQDGEGDNDEHNDNDEDASGDDDSEDTRNVSYQVLFSNTFLTPVTGL
jgi:hypothetical protein